MSRENESVSLRFGMGWLPDYPDFRDYTVEQSELPLKLKRLGEKNSVKSMIQKLGLGKSEEVSLPGSVDLTTGCSPIENQGNIGSCTAHAGIGIMEYCERRAFGKHIDASRLFLYKVTRNLLHWTGDTGAYLRTTMAAMAIFGVPPEEYWEYNTSDFDKEPSAFCYSFAQSYQSLQYVRLDPFNTPPALLLARIKGFLAAGLPTMFGFTVFSSIQQAEGDDGKIPFPCQGEKALGGHAIAAVGYDDKLKIKNNICGKETTGALLIRNSWGTDWGKKGYGWLPYEFVSKGLAIDWWALLKGEWFDTGKFGL